jgi:hypothetical protein
VPGREFERRGITCAPGCQPFLRGATFATWTAVSRG